MIRLKDLLKEETFTATNKQSGKTSVFKSKDSRDTAIKAGTHAAIKDKSQPSQPKAAGSDLFGGDYAKDRGGATPKADAGKKETPKYDLGVDSVVYNKRTKTVGIVRLGDERGETKTDADGNVNTSELEPYNPMKFPYQKDAQVAPSTKKEIESIKLFNPFSQKNDPINEPKKSADKAVLKGGKWQANPKTANDETQIELDMGFDPRSEREVKQAQAAFKKYNISVKPIGKPSPSGEITYAVNGKKKDILAYIQSSNYEMDAADVEEYYPELLDKGTETKSASKAVIKGGKWQPNPETANDETKIKLDMGWDTGSKRENKQAQAAFRKYNISVKPLKRLPSGEIEYEVNGKKKDILAYIQSSNYEMDTDDVKDYYSDLLK